MAKLMWICGILLVAAGIALGVVLLVSANLPPGLTIDTAAMLLVGGILSLGLGGVIDALRDQRAQRVVAVPEVAEAPAQSAAIPEFGPRSAKGAAVAAAATAAAATAAAAADVEEAPLAAAEEEVSRPTRDTIQALEQARQKIEQAFDARKSTPPVKEEPVEEEEVVVDEEIAVEEAVIDDSQLYVVEERVIRRHPARILSDGTVEAETSEGWMRFENLEHLDEYLDAVETA